MLCASKRIQVPGEPPYPEDVDKFEENPSREKTLIGEIDYS